MIKDLNKRIMKRFRLRKKSLSDRTEMSQKEYIPKLLRKPIEKS